MPLVDVADVNPESLGGGTNPDERFRYIDLGAVSCGSISWPDVHEMDFGHAPSRARRLVEPGDVLFGTVRPALQSHAAVATQEGRRLVASTGFSVIRAKSTTDPRFLAHVILSHPLFAQARRAEVGSNYPAVNESDVKQFSVPCPPLVEQRRISAILDTVDGAIRSTERLIAKLEYMRQGLLQDLFTKGIDEKGQLGDPLRHPERFVETSIGPLPMTWRTSRLGDICEIRSGSTPPRQSAVIYYANNGLPWVKTLDLHEDRLVETEEGVTELALRHTSCPLLPIGTVLVAMYGGWAQIGRTALLEIDATTNQAICGLTIREDMQPLFLLRALQHGRSRWKRVAASTRKDPNITKQDVTDFLVPVPSRREQTAIVEQFDQHVALIRSEESKLGKLRLLKAGLMDDLLTGRVRVPVDEDAA